MDSRRAALIRAASDGLAAQGDKNTVATATAWVAVVEAHARRAGIRDSAAGEGDMTPPAPTLRAQSEWRDELAKVIEQRDTAWRNLDMAHDDIAALLRASGLGDYARPISTHDVIQHELLPWIAAAALKASR